MMLNTAVTRRNLIYWHPLDRVELTDFATAAEPPRAKHGCPILEIKMLLLMVLMSAAMLLKPVRFPLSPGSFNKCGALLPSVGQWI